MRSAVLSLVLFLLTAFTPRTEARVWFVRYTAYPGDGSSWASPLGSIQDGINAASAGDEVWVQADILYDESIVLKSGVGVYGGFNGTETAKEQRGSDYTALCPSSNTSAVTVPPGTSPDTVLDGFRIGGGRGTLVNGTTCGGGIYVADATVTIRHCYVGGSANRGGAIYAARGSLYLTDSSVGGSADQSGGGIYLDSAAAFIRRSEISESNTSTGGMGGNIAAVNGSKISIRDSLVSQGTAGAGAGLYADGASGQIINCTFDGNFSHGAGTGWAVHLRNSPMAFVNTIMSSWYNVVTVEGSGAFPTFRNCDIHALAGGMPVVIGMPDPAGSNGNISAHPRTTDWVSVPPSHLLYNSPCRDAGDSSVVEPGETDGDGRLRVVGSAVDIGAFEYSPDAVALTFQTPPGSPVVGHPLQPQPRVAAVNPSGEVVTSWTGPVTLTMAGRQGTLTGETTVDAANGVASFSGLTVAELGDGYALQATTPEFAPIISPTFHVGIPVAYIAPWGHYAATGNSWGNALAAPESARYVSGAGGEVWVAAGTYKVSQVGLGEGISFYGGFAGTESDRSQRDWARNVTILDGGNTYTSVVAYGTAGDATMDGFTIKNGYLYGVRLSMPLAWSGASPTITLSHDRILQTITNGYGGIVNAGFRLVVRDCLIAANAGDGVHSHIEPPATQPVPALIVNNTIVGNTNGVVVDAGIVANNIVAFNTGSGIIPSSEVTLNHNDAYGNAGGDGAGPTDITADPLFLDRTNGDYRLLSGSPCVDAGDDASMLPGDVDLLGTARRQGQHVDIGAFELPDSGALTRADAVRALRFAGGLSAAAPVDAYLRVNGNGAYDLVNAIALIRKVAGLEPNP